MALSEVHGCDKIARAIEDSFEFRAFSSDYMANILQQRERFSPQPGPLHLTRRQDLLEVELEQPDLSVYEGSDRRILPATRAIIERKHPGGFDLMKPILLGEHKVGFTQNETTCTHLDHFYNDH
jgi:hypothetical protein